MSVCGGCPYPDEKIIAGEANSREEACGNWGCTFEDAAYRAQEAYDLLMERYEELEKENELLKAENDILKHKLKTWEDDGK